MPRRTRRGFPSAVLIALDPQKTTIYRVYSEAAKLHKRLPVANRRDEKEVYAHNEAVVNELRPLLHEGISSLVVTSKKTEYTNQFMGHLNKHHRWLIENSSIKTFVGSAETDASAYELMRGDLFKESLRSAVEDEEKSLLELLERYLIQGETVYTIKEAHDLFASHRLQYIILAETFYEAKRGTPQFQSLLQLAQNAGVKTRITKEEGLLGTRVRQLGGMVGLGGKRYDQTICSTRGQSCYNQIGYDIGILDTYVILENQCQSPTPSSRHVRRQRSGGDR